MENNPVALFKIHNLFKITGRGHVLFGDIVNGIINAGDSIRLPVDALEIDIKITSVEFADDLGGVYSVGLMLGLLDYDIKARFENMIGETIIIRKNS